jgi:Domain of unknown function (DUF4375)
MDMYQRCFPYFENACHRLQEVGFENLTPPERDVVCVFAMIAETNNGGLHQFYANSSGDFAAETADAFGRIGAIQVREIIHQANSVFGPNGPPKDRAARQEQLFALPEGLQEGRLGMLSDAFFECTEDIYALLYSNILAHRQEFVEATVRTPPPSPDWEFGWPKPTFVIPWKDK